MRVPRSHEHRANPRETPLPGLRSSAEHPEPAAYRRETARRAESSAGNPSHLGQVREPSAGVEQLVKLTGNRSRCQGCGEHFNSAWTFDGHRVGPYAPITEPNTRRCLTVAEMTGKGWSLNDGGFWISAKRGALALTARARAAIGTGAASGPGLGALAPLLARGALTETTPHGC